MLLGGGDSLRSDGFHGLWQQEEKVQFRNRQRWRWKVKTCSHMSFLCSCRILLPYTILLMIKEGEANGSPCRHRWLWAGRHQELRKRTNKWTSSLGLCKYINSKQEAFPGMQKPGRVSVTDWCLARRRNPLAGFSSLESLHSFESCY